MSFYGGTIIGGTLEQNDASFNSGLGFEFGYSERFMTELFGLTAEMDARILDVKGIEFLGKDYKFLFDLYAGPTIYFDSEIGLMVSAFAGYSFSAWIDNSISGGKLGSFSLKVSADIAIGHFQTGVFYRPLNQQVKDKSGLEFRIQPSFGVRVGLLL